MYQAVKEGQSLLVLCCGIGLELEGITTPDVTAVDIAPQYLAEVHSRCPQAKLVEGDARAFIEQAPDKSVDVISFIDGLEHVTKEDGIAILENCKRVARKEILVFTQEGFLRNEPHNAWGIEGADEYQTHKSGWEIKELEDLGYKLIEKQANISQHGEHYNAVMYRWESV